MADSPILTLLLEDIKSHMDTQIEAAKQELEETKQLRVEVNTVLWQGMLIGIEPDRWTEYETLTNGAARLRLIRSKNRPVTDMLDDIASEG